MRKLLTVRDTVLGLFGSAILAFGLYHVHSFAAVTEGGQLGLVLLLQHWLSLSPALTGLIINIICYAIGWRSLGFPFLARSGVCAIGFSLTYWICEQFPPLWPTLGQFPLVAALLGALFVGIGTGLCVRAGGAPSGDDAIAMSVSRRWKVKIEYVYLVSDLTVLALSLTYIPWQKIGYSLLTVTLSSFLVGMIDRLPVKKKSDCYSGQNKCNNRWDI